MFDTSYYPDGTSPEDFRHIFGADEDEGNRCKCGTTTDLEQCPDCKKMFCYECYDENFRCASCAEEVEENPDNVPLDCIGCARPVDQHGDVCTRCGRGIVAHSIVAAQDILEQRKQTDGTPWREME